MGRQDFPLQVFYVLLFLAHRDKVVCSSQRQHKRGGCQNIIEYDWKAGACTTRSNSFPVRNKTAYKVSQNCPEELNITVISYWPFHLIIQDQVLEMLGRCCGDYPPPNRVRKHVDN